MFILVLLWSGIYSGSCTGTQVTNVWLCTGTQVANVSPSGLAWEAFWKVTLIAPRVASEVMVKSGMSFRDDIRSTPGASPPRLGHRTGRDE